MRQLRIRAADGADAEDVARTYVDSWNAGFTDLLSQREITTELVARWRQDLVKPFPPGGWLKCSVQDPARQPAFMRRPVDEGSEANP
jgi:hypothetical protein